MFWWGRNGDLLVQADVDVIVPVRHGFRACRVGVGVCLIAASRSEGTGGDAAGGVVESVYVRADGAGQLGGVDAAPVDDLGVGVAEGAGGADGGGGVECAEDVGVEGCQR